jgi:Ca-activated chloride channel family protein
MIFQNMNWLPYGAAAFLIILAAALLRNFRYKKINFSNFLSLPAGGGAGKYMRFVPDALKILGVLLLVIALLRPQSIKKETQENIKGIDIMLALDISGSMQAEDLKPDRVEAAKEVCRNFVSGLVNDRAGLVVFAGKAFTQCPLTGWNYPGPRKLLYWQQTG